MPGKFYALVVGINDYPSSPLRGCVHDAFAMAELLEQRISEEHLELEILLDQQATRQGVIDAFRRHLGQARDGDQAFFFFAGHGSREEAPPELEHLEPDGMNETLVLQDSRQIGSRDLADKELGWLITELTRDHSPHVVVILDSCHSGDATRQGDGAGEGEDPSIAVRRGANDERPRPIESYLFYDSAVGIAPALATLEGAVGPQTWSLVPAPGKQSTEGFDPLAAEGRDHHVLLSACRSSELAQERRVGDQMRGLFSLYLVHALSRIDANATYRDLLMQVRTQVHLANPRQWPQATGDLRGRIFDGLVIPRPQTFTVRPTPAAGGHWRLNAGAVHGMQVDSELAVFPEDRLDTRDLSQALATLRITRVRTAESELALVRGEMPRAAGALPAVVTQLPLPPLIVSVPETAVDDEASELLRAFRIKVRSSPVLGLEPRGEAWVEVRLQDDFARLVRPGAGDLIDPLPVKYPEDWQPILDRLEHIARWRVVFCLEQSGGQLQEDLEMEVLRWLGPPDKAGEPPQTAPWEAEPGDDAVRRFTVRLHNRGNAGFFFALVGVSEDFGAAVLRRGKGWLEPKETLWLRKYEGITSSVLRRDHERGVTRQQDLLLLIASEVEADTGLLEHPPLLRSETRSPSADRGATTGVLEAFLRRLDGNFRTLDAAELESLNHRWITVRNLIVAERPAPELAFEGGETITQSGLEISVPADLQGRARPHSTVSADRLLKRLPTLPEDLASELRRYALAGRTLNDGGLTALELEIEQGVGMLQAPLRIAGQESMEPGEALIALAFDGERMVWSGPPVEQRPATCEVAFLPPPAPGHDRVWLFFYGYRAAARPAGEVRPGEPAGVLPEDPGSNRQSQPGPTLSLGRQGLFGKIGDRVQAFRRLSEGDDHQNSGRFEAALVSYQEALDLFEGLGSKSGIGTALGALGNTYHALGQYRTSLECHQRRLELLRTTFGTWRLQGRTLSGIGNAHLALGNGQEAIRHFEHHLELAHQIEDRQEETTALGNLAGVYTILGHYDRAIDLSQKALAIDRELGEVRLIHHSLSTLGGLYLGKGDLPTAIGHHQQALELAREAGYERGEAQSLANLADPQLHIGAWQKAAEYGAAAIEIFERLGDRHSLGQVLAKLGSAYFNLRQYEKAQETLERSLDATRASGDLRSQTLALHCLGHIHVHRNELEEALTLYRENLELKQRLGNTDDTAVAWSNLAMVYALQGADDPSRLDEAITTYRRAVELAEEPISEGSILNNLGGALYRAGRLEDAEAALRRTLTIWESLRGTLTDSDRITIYDQQFSSYGLLQRVLIANDRPVAALEIAERGRSRSLNLLMGRQLADEYALEPEVAPPNIDEMRGIARRANAVVIFYATMYEDSGHVDRRIREIFLWAIDADGQVRFRRTPAETFAPLAELETEGGWIPDSLRGAIGTRAIDQADGSPPTPETVYKPALRLLYDALVAPIEDMLPGPDHTVVLVPDSHLLLMPFGALLDAEGRPFIERQALVVAPSIRSLELMAERQRQVAGGPSTALVVGNPVMPELQRPGGDTYRLEPLDHAEQEAEQIAQLFETHPLLGAEATKRAVLRALPAKRFVHLATHGLFREDDATEMPGAVVLAGATPQEALLTPLEIIDLDLDAELVVLSACNTGYGRFTQEGLVGLSRALLQAGAASVIVSLWPVYDSSTAFLMTKLYRALQGGASKAEALRTAVLETRQRYEHPSHWAPFMLIGETR